MSAAADQPLQKRIKRHVSGPAHTFFAVVAPGLEALCRGELAALLGDGRSLTPVPGGVVFEGRLEDLYLANLQLRTASRVLMRIAEFKVVGFGALEKRLAEIPWELYLPAGEAPAVHVTARHSRLYHSQAVAERIRVAVAQRFAALAAGPGAAGVPAAPQQLFARLLDDRLTLSLDSSGENLYKRGLKTHGGRAPLRETLAAAILQIAGYSGAEPLLDPMCGSGTFCLEAALMAARIAPGRQRSFAFMRWPAFRPARWRHLLRQADAAAAVPERRRIFALDKSPRSVQRLAQTLEAKGLAAWVGVARGDFFDLDPRSLTAATGLVVINPPYGRRLGTPAASARLFRQILARLQAVYPGWRCALIAPDSKLVEDLPFALRILPLTHGGLRLPLLVGRIPRGAVQPRRQVP
jgi:putative N6-adenine-specific DNA methylase